MGKKRKFTSPILPAPYQWGFSVLAYANEYTVECPKCRRGGRYIDKVYLNTKSRIVEFTITCNECREDNTKYNYMFKLNANIIKELTEGFNTKCHHCGGIRHVYVDSTQWQLCIRCIMLVHMSKLKPPYQCTGCCRPVTSSVSSYGISLMTSSLVRGHVNCVMELASTYCVYQLTLVSLI